MRGYPGATDLHPMKYVMLDGRVLTVADLPQRPTRWVLRRKAEVVAAVDAGLLSLEDACERYDLTAEEFLGWQRVLERHPGLRGTPPLPMRSAKFVRREKV